MSYVIKQQGLKGGNLPRSGLLEHLNQPDRQKARWLVIKALGGRLRRDEE